MLSFLPRKIISIFCCCTSFITKVVHAWLDVIVVSYYDKIIKATDTIQHKYGHEIIAFVFSIIMFGLLIFWMQDANFMSERIFISFICASIKQVQ